MDYGKLALSKIEDLSQMMLSAKGKTTGFKFLLFLVTESTEFNGIYNSSTVVFKSVNAPLFLDVFFCLESAVEGVCNCKIHLNNAVLDSKIIETDAGKNQYQLSFVGNGDLNGECSLKISFDFGDIINRKISGLNMRLFGNIENINEKSKLIVSEEGSFVKLAYNDRDFVYYCIILNNKILTMSKFFKRGDFSFCACRHLGDDNKYDIIYFFVDESKLFMQVIPYHSDFLPYRLLLDENVTAIDCVKTESPRGCMLYYLKGGKVICRPVEKDILQNKILADCGIEALTAPLCINISAMQGENEGFGFVLNEKKDKNSLYLHIGKFYSTPYDTVNAQITATVEDLL